MFGILKLDSINSRLSRQNISLSSDVASAEYGRFILFRHVSCSSLVRLYPTIYAIPFNSAASKPWLTDSSNGSNGRSVKSPQSTKGSSTSSAKVTSSFVSSSTVLSTKEVVLSGSQFVLADSFVDRFTMQYLSATPNCSAFGTSLFPHARRTAENWFSSGS